MVVLLGEDGAKLFKGEAGCFFDNLSAASKAVRVHNVGNLREAYPQVYEKIGYYIEYKLSGTVSEACKAELLRYISTNSNKRKVHKGIERTGQKKW